MKEIKPKERGKTNENEIIEQLIMVGLMVPTCELLWVATVLYKNM